MKENEKENLRYICSEFTSLPLEKIPEDKNKIIETLISESIRLALKDLSENEYLKRPIHILALKNWVIRKLRSIISNMEDVESNLFNNVLKESSGPNMKFLGDVVELANGYYLPGPTRVIRLEDDSWVLISGLPTKIFIDMGLNIEVMGLNRRFINTSKSEIEDLEIPIQTIESYVGIDEISKNPEVFITNLINYEFKHKWQSESNWEIYNPKAWAVGGFGFSVPKYKKNFQVEYNNYALSFWREPLEHQSDIYWLRIGYKLNRPKPVKRTINGRMKFVTVDYEYRHGIQIHPKYLRQLCLALDKISGHPRVANFKTSGNCNYVTMKFSPPHYIWRWFFATSAKFRTDPDYIDLEIKKDTVNNTIELLNRFGIETKFIKNGEKNDINS